MQAERQNDQQERLFPAWQANTSSGPWKRKKQARKAAEAMWLAVHDDKDTGQGVTAHLRLGSGGIPQQQHVDVASQAGSIGKVLQG